MYPLSIVRYFRDPAVRYCYALRYGSKFRGLEVLRMTQVSAAAARFFSVHNKVFLYNVSKY